MKHVPKYDPSKVFKPEITRIKKFYGAKLENDGKWYFGKIGPFDTALEAVKEGHKIKIYGNKKKKWENVMPTVKRNGKWFWGSVGPFDTKAEADAVGRAIKAKQAIDNHEGKKS